MNFLKAICILLIMACFVPELTARQSEEPPANAEVIIEQSQIAFRSSNLLSEVSSPFLFQANIPSQYRRPLVQSLIDLGLPLHAEGNGMHRLQLEYHMDNRLRFINREQAERVIEGKMTLYYLDEQQAVVGTEELRIFYEDLVSATITGRLAETWPATTFSEEIPAQQSRLSRYGRPAIIVAATGVTVFLLYNVRSR